MATKRIEMGCNGIVVTLNVEEDGEYDCGVIESDFGEDNNMIDVLESLILAHAVAGIDITTPEYLEGVETTIDKILNSI